MADMFNHHTEEPNVVGDISTEGGAWQEKAAECVTVGEELFYSYGKVSTAHATIFILWLLRCTLKMCE